MRGLTNTLYYYYYYHDTYICITVLEEQKNLIDKEVSELRKKLQDSDKSCLDLCQVKQDLSRQIRSLEDDRMRINQEISEYQMRITHLDEKEDELRKEIFSLKKKVLAYLHLG